MKAYLFNKNTGLYSGEKDLQIDPLETKKAGKEVYAKPPYCTLVKPEISEEKIPFWNKEKSEWEYVDNKLGENFYELDDDGFIVNEGKIEIENIREKSKHIIKTKKPEKLIKAKFLNDEWIEGEEPEKIQEIQVKTQEQEIRAATNELVLDYIRDAIILGKPQNEIILIKEKIEAEIGKIKNKYKEVKNV